MIKKGDTLIEVTLAVGIFSMVAVAVVAVMSNGTAGAQTSLETTLTREQIDAQAEALRFIHSAYISDMEGQDGRYSKLWEHITDNAIELNGSNTDVTQFSIGSCDNMYHIQWPSTENKQPFAININYLGEYANLSKNELSDDAVSQAIKTFDSGFLVPARTYPHLIYSNEYSDITADISKASLSENGVEGIYIVAVKDDNSTSVVDGSGKNASNVSAFYDFYIRTCWYGVGDNTPSTISTVIRLYDPNAIVIYTPEPEPEPEPEPSPEPSPEPEPTQPTCQPNKTISWSKTSSQDLTIQTSDTDAISIIYLGGGPISNGTTGACIKSAGNNSITISASCLSHLQTDSTTIQIEKPGCTETINLEIEN